MSQPLFDVINEVQEQIKSARHVLLCLDFDGTLTHFTATPNGAHLSPQMERVLQSLANHPKSSLAVISGRARDDLQLRVGIPGLIYAGNHGLEISGPGYLFVDPTAAEQVEALKSMVGRLEAKFESVPGALVEFKGLTISVHYRQVPPEQWEDVRRMVHAVLSQTSHPFVLAAGEKVFDIRPRVYWHKGSAVEWIAAKLGKPGTLPIYVGDDVTDEDAFAALTQGITVKVGEAGQTAARYQLDGPPEVRKFLEWIDELMRQMEFHRVEAQCKSPEEVVVG